MPAPDDANLIPDERAAFADGELDPARTLGMLRLVSNVPQAARDVENQVRLRQSVARVMSSVPAPSAALRASLEQLAGEAPHPMPQHPAHAHGAPAPHEAHAGFEPLRLPHRRWAIPIWAAAAAVFIAVGMIAGRYISHYDTVALPSTKPSETAPPLASTAPVPLVYVNEATRTHVDCSRYPDLHTGTWPQALGSLGPPLLKYLHRDKPWPDLSSIGYKYLGAGPCDKPLEHAAHLLYKSTRPGDYDTISVFVQVYDGHSPLEEGKVYRVAGKDAAHPMIVWRHDDMVFYLVGDAEEPLEKAANAMHVAVPT